MESIIPVVSFAVSFLLALGYVVWSSRKDSQNLANLIKTQSKQVKKTVESEPPDFYDRHEFVTRLLELKSRIEAIERNWDALQDEVATKLNRANTRLRRAKKVAEETEISAEMQDEDDAEIDETEAGEQYRLPLSNGSSLTAEQDRLAQVRARIRGT